MIWTILLQKKRERFGSFHKITFQGLSSGGNVGIFSNLKVLLNYNKENVEEIYLIFK